MSVKKNIYQSTVSGQIQDIAKPFTSVEGQKTKWAKITLYTLVIHILIYRYNKMTFQNQTSHHQTINISS